MRIIDSAAVQARRTGVTRGRPLRISFIADWRSPTARGWIEGAARLGYSCQVLSTHPLGAAAPAAGPSIRMVAVPIAASALRRRIAESSSGAARVVSGAPVSVLARVRRVVAPYDIVRHVAVADQHLAGFDPDVVHALRIPYAGIFASRLHGDWPLVVSVWGNDFTLHADKTHRIRRMTRRTIERADFLLADAQHDLDLAARFGLDEVTPTAVLPGGGGLDIDRFEHLPSAAAARSRLGLPPDGLVILNPRGNREYVRTMEYTDALSPVARVLPTATFVFADMADNTTLAARLRRLGLADRSRLLPRISRDEMALLFRAADIAVSPSTHDGTPNTLLEAMAAGAFPIAGDIPALREWIEPGVNGLLCDPCQPAAISTAILDVAADPGLRARAAERNRLLVSERAACRNVQAAMGRIYSSLVPAGD